MGQFQVADAGHVAVLLGKALKDLNDALETIESQRQQIEVLKKEKADGSQLDQGSGQASRSTESQGSEDGPDSPRPNIEP